MKPTLIAALLSVTINTPSFAQTLNQYFDTVSGTSKEMRVNIIDLNGAKEFRNQANTVFRPEIFLNYNSPLPQYNKTTVGSSSSEIDLKVGGPSIFIRQPIFGGELYYRKQKLDTQAKVGEANFNVRNQNFYKSTVKHYLDYFYAKLGLAVNERFIKTPYLSKLDPSKKKEFVDVVTQIDQKFKELITSSEVQRKTPTADQLTFDFNKFDVFAAPNIDTHKFRQKVNKIEANNPQLTLLRQQSKEIETEAKRIKASTLPRVDAIGAYQQNKIDYDNGTRVLTGQAGFGLTLSMQLSNGGLTDSQYRQLMTNTDKFAIEIEELSPQLRKQGDELFAKFEQVDKAYQLMISPALQHVWAHVSDPESRGTDIGGTDLIQAYILMIQLLSVQKDLHVLDTEITSLSRGLTRADIDSFSTQILSSRVGLD